MTITRHLAHLLLAWIGGVWVYGGGDAAWQGSWTTAWWTFAATAILAAVLAVLVVWDVRDGRLHIRKPRTTGGHRWRN